MGKSKVFWLIVSVVYTCVLVYFSFANVDSIIPDSGNYPIDKLFHFAAYVIFSGLWVVWYTKASIQVDFIVLTVGLLAFGIGMESIQEIISPFRTFDWLDLVANCFGVLCGTIIATYFTKSKVKMD